MIGGWWGGCQGRGATAKRGGLCEDEGDDGPKRNLRVVEANLIMESAFLREDSMGNSGDESYGEMVNAISSVSQRLKDLVDQAIEIKGEVRKVSQTVNTIWEVNAFHEIKEGIEAIKNQHHRLEQVQTQMEGRLQAVLQEQEKVGGQMETLKAIQEEQNNLKRLVEATGTQLSDDFARQDTVTQEILTTMHRSEENRVLEWFPSTGLGIIAVALGGVAVTKPPYHYWWLLAIVCAFGLGIGLIFAQPAGLLGRWIRERRERSNRRVGGA
jgi:hypothetical protein